MLSIVLAAALLAPPQISVGRSKTRPPADAPQTSILKGTVRTIDEKTLVLDASDQRILAVALTDKTFFLQDGKGIARNAIQIGDAVEVEATQNEHAAYQAMVVKVVGRPASAPAARSAPAPVAKADDDDEGPPTLKRGAPPKRASKPLPQISEAEIAAARAAASASSETARPVETAAPPVPTNPKMVLVSKARENASNFIESLPNYLVQQMTTHYAGRVAKTINWEPQNVVTANVVYENHKENYRDVTVNGKLTGKGIEETGGTWSTGEFGTILIDLFSPATNASFHYLKDSTASGHTAALYEFEVEKENSHWHVMTEGQEYVPAYRGSVWVDKETGKTLRIEMEAVRLPSSFPLNQVETAVDYSNVRLGEQSYVLAVHAENLMCSSDNGYCSRSVIDFRNYRKFSSDTKITFEGK